MSDLSDWDLDRRTVGLSALTTAALALLLAVGGLLTAGYMVAVNLSRGWQTVLVAAITVGCVLLAVAVVRGARHDVVLRPPVCIDEEVSR